MVVVYTCLLEKGNLKFYATEKKTRISQTVKGTVNGGVNQIPLKCLTK